MNKLKILIANEVKTDLTTKSFWITTFAVPLVLALFGGVFGFLMADSDTFMNSTHGMNLGPDTDEITPLKALGMLLGIFPVIFLMMYGSLIFNKVKTEKCNRLVEILATCVDGKTMMMSKIIAVGIIGLIQLALWFALILLFGFLLILVSGVGIPWSTIFNHNLWLALMWTVLFFIGGYTFYGALFAAIGATTDKNNENQSYIALLTFLLLGSFYIGEYALDHASGAFVMTCCYVPFTSSTILTVVSASQESPLWLSLTGLTVLYVFAFVAIILAGKIYTSTLLLTGKKLTPYDFITFIRAK